MKKLFLMLALALPLAISAQKIGYINASDLFQQMPELTVIKAQLDTIQGQYESQLANMQEEFNKKVAAFQSEQATLTDGVKEFRQQELAEMEQRIQTFYQTAQQDIQKKSQELMIPVHKRMADAITAVGKAQGFTYIFDAAATLYVSPEATDLMPAVKAELNIK